jgi:hypothetical protein
MYYYKHVAKNTGIVHILRKKMYDGGCLPSSQRPALLFFHNEPAIDICVTLDRGGPCL